MEEPVARELEKLSSPLPSDPKGYRLYLADAEKVRLLLREEFIAGNVSGARVLSGQRVQPVSPGEQRSSTGQVVQGYRSDFGKRWGILSSSHFTDGQLTGTAKGLRLVGHLETTQVSAADDAWRSSLRELRNISPTAIDTELWPGEVLMAVLDLGTIGQARRCHLILMHCTKVTASQAVVLQDMNESEYWLRLGPAGARMVADFRTAYGASADRHDRNPDAWTKALSDGSTIQLVSVGLPSRWPTLAWDPDGAPMLESVGWELANNPADRNADSTFLQIIIESPYPIGVINELKPGPNEATRYRTYQRAVWSGHVVRGVGVRMGVGPWRAAGRVNEGATLTAGDAQVTIGKIEPGNFTIITYSMSRSTDCFTIVGVAADGTRLWPSHCVPALPWGDYAVRWLDQRTEQAHIPVRMGTTVDHYELLWRKSEVVQFDGYALEPSERPPFDLTRDYLLQAGTEPTRTATSRPVLADKNLPAASMLELIAAAQKGDVTVAAKYLTGGTSEQRQLLAQMLSDIMTLPQAFQAKYGVPLQGRISQGSKEIQADLFDSDLIINAPDSISTHRIVFRRQRGGHWAIDVTSLLPDTGDIERMRRQANIFNQARQFVETKTYPSAAEAQEAIDALTAK